MNCDLEPLLPAGFPSTERTPRNRTGDFAHDIFVFWQLLSVRQSAEEGKSEAKAGSGTHGLLSGGDAILDHLLYGRIVEPKFSKNLLRMLSLARQIATYTETFTTDGQRHIR